MAPPLSDLVLLHGFTNTAASWDGVLAALPESYRPLSLDIRGHGAAADRHPVSLEAVLDDVALLAPRRFALVGYSQGGRVALHAALAPALAGRVARLVLIGASPGIADPTERAQRHAADEALAAWAETIAIEEFVSRWERVAVLADQPAAVRAAATADRLRNTTTGLAAALRGLGTGTLAPVWDRLGEIAVPVELVVGERDATFRATADAMAQALPDARVHVVAGAGHAVHLEDPYAVAGLLVGLL